jgi:hypothetical protein
MTKLLWGIYGPDVLSSSISSQHLVLCVTQFSCRLRCCVAQFNVPSIWCCILPTSMLPQHLVLCIAQFHLAPIFGVLCCPVPCCPNIWCCVLFSSMSPQYLVFVIHFSCPRCCSAQIHVAPIFCVAYCPVSCRPNIWCVLPSFMSPQHWCCILLRLMSPQYLVLCVAQFLVSPEFYLYDTETRVVSDGQCSVLLYEAVRDSQTCNTIRRDMLEAGEAIRRQLWVPGTEICMSLEMLYADGLLTFGFSKLGT